MFNFGIADFVVLEGDGDISLVQLTCRCVVIVARGRIIRRAGAVNVVCEHVSTPERRHPAPLA